MSNIDRSGIFVEVVVFVGCILLIHLTVHSLTATPPPKCVWQVIESSKRWWKCRNRFDQIGFVPFNILEPIAHIDSPVTNKPPSVRHKRSHASHVTLSPVHTWVNSSVSLSLCSTFPQAPAPPPLAKTFSAVPPSPPALPQAPSPQRPRSLPPYSQHITAAEDTDKGTKLQYMLTV